MTMQYTEKSFSTFRCDKHLSCLVLDSATGLLYEGFAIRVWGCKRHCAGAVVGNFVRFIERGWKPRSGDRNVVPLIYYDNCSERFCHPAWLSNARQDLSSNGTVRTGNSAFQTGSGFKSEKAGDISPFDKVRYPELGVYPV